MTPNAIRRTALSQLKKTREAMLGPEYLTAMLALPEDAQKEAALQLSRIQVAWLKLRAAELEEIRQRLLNNEDALKSGIAAMEKSLETIREVEEVVKAAAGFVNVIGRVVALG